MNILRQRHEKSNVLKNGFFFYKFRSESLFRLFDFAAVRQSIDVFIKYLELLCTEAVLMFE